MGQQQQQQAMPGRRRSGRRRKRQGRVVLLLPPVRRASLPRRRRELWQRPLAGPRHQQQVVQQLPALRASFLLLSRRAWQGRLLQPRPCLQQQRHQGPRSWAALLEQQHHSRRRRHLPRKKVRLRGLVVREWQTGAGRMPLGTEADLAFGETPNAVN